MIAIADQPLTASALLCVTRIQFCMLNNRCQTEERKEAFAFLLLWTLFFQSSHFFSCHDSVNRSLSFSHACCILMRDQFMNVICRAKRGPARPWRCIQVLAGQPNACSRFVPRRVSAPHLCCMPAVGNAAGRPDNCSDQKCLTRCFSFVMRKKSWDSFTEIGECLQSCAIGKAEICGTAGSWKLLGVCSWEHSSSGRWGEGRLDLTQESTAVSDDASQQRAVCCGTDPATASHCPQLPMVKIGGETQR